MLRVPISDAKKGRFTVVGLLKNRAGPGQGARGVTATDVEDAHRADLQVQDRYGVTLKQLET